MKKIRAKLTLALVVAAFLGGCDNPAGNDPVYTVTIAPLTHGAITAAPEQAEAGCA